MTGRFESRPTRSTGLLRINGWRLKRYEITLDGDSVADDIGRAVQVTLEAALPPVPDAEFGVGFLIVHHGTESVWALADLWKGDILSQLTFSAPLDHPTSFAAVPVGGPTACVWELPVHAHERDAFVKHVLDPAAGPDVEGYLAHWFDPASQSNEELLRAFNDAWGRGNVDDLMALMSDNPTYRASTGDGPGVDYTGREEVRAGFAGVISTESASGVESPPGGEVVVFGDRGLSKWSYPTTGVDGETVLVQGVDVWTFADGRIATKDAYRKSFPDQRP